MKGVGEDRSYNARIGDGSDKSAGSNKETSLRTSMNWMRGWRKLSRSIDVHWCAKWSEWDSTMDDDKL